MITAETDLKLEETFAPEQINIILTRDNYLVWLYQNPSGNIQDYILELLKDAYNKTERALIWGKQLYLREFTW